MSTNKELLKALTRLVFDLKELFEESYGVAGLNLNGEIARWEDLTRGGFMDEWLFSYDAAYDLLEKIQSLESNSEAQEK
ncbi:hypothetical protein LVJ82_00760 [Vitreoscilla massiliensis]|uniref:Phage protein n=1 Tax=Vitreoscilla massiliensis TaxID=1689272 RepID=A0ABY4E174_9NEIS|nr:hypothetical protein [Vitreoscilla massiliensis]UOO89098.1 hypothetical protein LVJ82_16900 [Vitreoscilla massiliensis]UOO89546.1 hypothetical protein LVJ82_00760 [Vitreoscilla massiliensis]